MAYIGKTPTSAPLTSSDITDGIISNAKLAQDIISADTALGAEPADTDEFLVSDAGTLKRMDYSYIKAANTPAFEANLGTTTGITDNTFVKATFDTEVFDTDGTFASDRFTPAVAGKYFCYTGIRVGNDGTDTLSLHQIAFYKNGSAHLVNTTPTVMLNAGSYNANNDGRMLAQTIDLDADDYVEVYVHCNTTANSPDLINGSFFGAYKIIT